MQVKVKICGITNFDDAMAAVESGADALGFVFFKESPRYISYTNAASIINKLPSFLTTVGVFVSERPEHIENIITMTGIDVVQLHGEEPPEKCIFMRRVIKAIRVETLESLDSLINYREIVSAFLLDTFTHGLFGGTGKIFNWDIAIEAKQFGRIILAGGLTPDNVTEAVRRVSPYGVDVSSGVEFERGRKDHKKMQLFIERAKGT
jgi:phosphoribosylanthranilate isomerase